MTGSAQVLLRSTPALFIQSALPRPQLGFADGRASHCSDYVARPAAGWTCRLIVVYWGFLDRAATAKRGRIAAARTGPTECPAPQTRLAVCARQTAIPDILLNAALG